MSKPASKTKPAHVKRRTNSAIAGGVLLSRPDLMERWGLTMRTIIAKEKSGLLVPIKLGNDQVVRYALTDIMRIEAEGKTK